MGVCVSEQQGRRGVLPVLIVLGVLTLLALAALLYVRGRNAVNDLNAQLHLLQQADDSSETLYEWAGDDARAIVGGLRGFVLPPEADGLQLARQGNNRPFYWLRATVPAEVLPTLLTSTCLPPLSDSTPDFIYSTHPDIIANLPWWQPDAAEHLSGAACTDGSGIHYRLLVVEDATTATVYLEIAPV